MSPRHSAAADGMRQPRPLTNVNANAQLLEALTRSKTFQTYARSYTETTSLPITLRASETWQLPFHDKPKENAFCALMAGQTHACAACLQLQEKLGQAAMNAPATRTCAFGLCETAVPVKLGSQTIGYLQTGQVFRQPPDEASFRRAIKQGRKLGVDFGNEPTKRAYFATPVVGHRKLDAVSNLLAIFADHLAMSSNQFMVQAANAELPVITKARQFIGEHYTENLSLMQVARAVNTSSFYFCK